MSVGKRSLMMNLRMIATTSHIFHFSTRGFNSENLLKGILIHSHIDRSIISTLVMVL